MTTSRYMRGSCSRAPELCILIGSKACLNCLGIRQKVTQTKRNKNKNKVYLLCPDMLDITLDILETAPDMLDIAPDMLDIMLNIPE